MSRLSTIGSVLIVLALSAQAAAAAEMKAVSGAVGIEDRARMMKAYAEYNLHLAFANTKGEFLADVELALRGADGGAVWRGSSEGPYWFARLPEGSYLVTAEFGGRALTRRIEVGPNPGPLHYFHWK